MCTCKICCTNDCPKIMRSSIPSNRIKKGSSPFSSALKQILNRSIFICRDNCHNSWWCSFVSWFKRSLSTNLRIASVFLCLSYDRTDQSILIHPIQKSCQLVSLLLKPRSRHYALRSDLLYDSCSSPVSSFYSNQNRSRSILMMRSISLPDINIQPKLPLRCFL